MHKDGHSQLFAMERFWGTWRTLLRCSMGHFVKSFQSRVRKDLGGIRDDTAMNAISVRNNWTTF
jgi:hypothetical protein